MCYNVLAGSEAGSFLHLLLSLSGWRREGQTFCYHRRKAGGTTARKGGFIDCNGTH